MILAVVTLEVVTLVVVTLAGVILEVVVTLAVVTLAAMTLAAVISNCKKNSDPLLSSRTYVRTFGSNSTPFFCYTSFLRSPQTIQSFSIMFSVAVLLTNFYSLLISVPYRDDFIQGIYNRYQSLIFKFFLHSVPPEYWPFYYCTSSARLHLYCMSDVRRGSAYQFRTVPESETCDDTFDIKYLHPYRQPTTSGQAWHFPTESNQIYQRFFFIYLGSWTRTSAPCFLIYMPIQIYTGESGSTCQIASTSTSMVVIYYTL